MGSVSVVRMLPLGRVHRRRELNLATCSWGLTKMNFILCRFSQSIIICQPDLRYFVFSNLLAMASEVLVRYGHFFLWMWVFFLWLKIHLGFSLWAVLKGINFFASRKETTQPWFLLASAVVFHLSQEKVLDQVDFWFTIQMLMMKFILV